MLSSESELISYFMPIPGYINTIACVSHFGVHININIIVESFVVAGLKVGVYNFSDGVTIPMIHHLRIDESYRRQGHASLMLLEAFKILANVPCVNSVCLFVAYNNFPAMNLYTKLGFKEFVSKDDDGYILMKKNLSHQ